MTKIFARLRTEYTPNIFPCQLFNLKVIILFIINLNSLLYFITEKFKNIHQSSVSVIRLIINNHPIIQYSYLNWTEISSISSFYRLGQFQTIWIKYILILSFYRSGYFIQLLIYNYMWNDCTDSYLHTFINLYVHKLKRIYKSYEFNNNVHSATVIVH